MKYIVIVCDGLSERSPGCPTDETPLSDAHTPTLDHLVQKSEIGIIKLSGSVHQPSNIKANMAVLGYWSEDRYGDFTCFEALAGSISIEEDDVIFKCRPIILSDSEDFEERIMIRYEDELLNEQVLTKLTDLLNEELGNKNFSFRCSKNAGMFLVWKKGEPDPGILCPPDEVYDHAIKDYLPKGDFTPVLTDIMKRSVGILTGHPIQLSDGRAINAVWFWGADVKPDIQSFSERYGKDALIISPDIVMQGFGKAMGMNVVPHIADVETISSYIYGHENVIYIHVTEPYELAFDTELRKKSIEKTDREIIEPVVSLMERKGGDYTLAVISSVSLSRENSECTAQAVPYMIYRSDSKTESNADFFSEKTAFESGIYLPYKYDLMKRILNKEIPSL